MNAHEKRFLIDKYNMCSKVLEHGNNFDTEFAETLTNKEDLSFKSCAFNVFIFSKSIRNKLVVKSLLEYFYCKYIKQSNF